MADEAAVQVYRAFIDGCVGVGAAPFTIFWLTWNGWWTATVSKCRGKALTFVHWKHCTMTSSGVLPAIPGSVR